MTRIKICGLTRPEDIEYVNRAMPDYCGFVVDFPKSRRSVTPERARALCALLWDGIAPVGVFVDEPAEIVAELLNDGTLAAVQLHGGEDEGYIARLRALAPGCVIWRAFRIRSQGDLDDARRSTADMVLLDNGQGTGESFDWSLLRGFPRPYILAGGLTPENIPEAIERLRPWGVDMSSGVETCHVKDPEKIYAAVSAARKE